MGNNRIAGSGSVGMMKDYGKRDSLESLNSSFSKPPAGGGAVTISIPMVTDELWRSLGSLESLNSRLEGMFGRLTGTGGDTGLEKGYAPPVGIMPNLVEISRVLSERLDTAHNWLTTLELYE